MQWFRFYHEFRHDTKMKRMPIPHRYAFVVLLCLASENSARGRITGLDDEDIAFELEMELEDWQTLKSKFRVKGLIELGPDGTIIIANWDKRQFVSDSSSERVAAHRAKKKKRGCNVTPTLAKQDVTPSETDTDPEAYSDADPKPLNTAAPLKKKEAVSIARVEFDPVETDPFLSSAIATECKQFMMGAGNEWNEKALSEWAQLWRLSKREPGAENINLKSFIRKNLNPKAEKHGQMMDEYGIVKAKLSKKPTRPTVAQPIHDSDAVGQDVMAHAEWVKTATPEEKAQKAAEVRAQVAAARQMVEAQRNVSA